MNFKLAGIAGLALAMTAGAAMAHPKIVKMTPSSGGEISRTLVKEIRLTFSEPVNAAFSGLELTAPSGATIKTGAARVDPKDHKQLIVPVTGSLMTGVTKVKWHAVAEDTHRVEGTYSFTVK